MDPDRLYEDPSLAQFYDLENGWAQDLEYCTRLAAGCSSVLDLGCGTGRFVAALAERHQRVVVGVDPAEAMLDIARQRPGGDGVQWVRDDARSVRLNRRFDLVVLTGHAFQVFLTEADQAAVLRTIAHHLEPSGRFIFDTRNPDVAEWREWTPAMSERFIEHPALGRMRAWNAASQDPATGIVTYETYYEVVADGRTFSARSRIAFPARKQVAEMIEEAGLVVEEWLGTWSGSPFAPDAPEIIPVGGLR